MLDIKCAREALYFSTRVVKPNTEKACRHGFDARDKSSAQARETVDNISIRL